MSRIQRRTMIKTALVPAALLLAIGGSATAAFGGSAHHPVTYQMILSSTSATVQAGGTTTTTISFEASKALYGKKVDLSVSGLPSGVTASFSPQQPHVRDQSTLTLTTAPSSSAGSFTVTVNAIVTNPSDPIGTSATFGLTINGS
jgi:hypothetical protein